MPSSNAVTVQALYDLSPLVRMMFGGAMLALAPMAPPNIIRTSGDRS